MKIWLSLIAVLSIIGVKTAIAQDFNGYEPPPLFGGSEAVEDTVPDGTKIVPKKVEPPKIVPKKVVPSKTIVKKTEEKPKPKIVIEKTDETIIKSPQPKKVPPIPLKKADVPSPVAPRIDEQPKSKNIAPKNMVPESVVTGPKTMPAVKKQGVEAEVMFQSDNKATSTMMDRVQENSGNETKAPEAIPKQKPEATELAILSEARNWSLEFDGNAPIISEEQLSLITSEIVPLLVNKPDARLSIDSSATSNNADQLNADRRLALSRALSIRGLLIENGILSSRIDVHAAGSLDRSKADNLVKISLQD